MDIVRSNMNERPVYFAVTTPDNSKIGLDDYFEMEIRKPDGTLIKIEYDVMESGLLEIEFEDKPIRRCRNNCIFCFIDQLPNGLRRSLYIKDEDYRQSFLHGNYITLTNLTKKDFKKIIEMRLSPLFVSVHTTDEKLRKMMLGREDLPDLMPQLKSLIEADICVHAQVVVCPGINDSAHLEKTISDLAELYPDLNSLAIVPVGLTNHRQNLPELKPVTPLKARELLTQIEKLQIQFMKKLGSRFVFPSDEIFILAGKAIPPPDYYEDFPQIEDGVGMLRQFFSVNKLQARKLKDKPRAAFVTGEMMANILPGILEDKFSRIENLSWEVVPVENKLLGKSVTVSGLLGGQDVYDVIRERKDDFDIVILPPNCVNQDRIMLDDWFAQDIEDKLNIPVEIGCYSLYNTFMDAFRRYF
jgi:putative radical SAM enzyme (TIGR03279 family)